MNNQTIFMEADKIANVSLVSIQDKVFPVEYRLPLDSHGTWNKNGFLTFELPDETNTLNATVKNSDNQEKAKFIVKEFSDKENITVCRREKGSWGSSISGKTYRIDLISDNNEIYSFNFENNDEYKKLYTRLNLASDNNIIDKITGTNSCDYMDKGKSGGKKKRKTVKNMSKKRKTVKKMRKKRKTVKKMSKKRKSIRK